MSELLTADCPACTGRGRLPSMSAMGDDPICAACRGLGYVLPDEFCVCGRSPNYRAEAGFLFCGAQACLDALKKTLAV